ncbi:MAG: hypothetical protein Q9224_003465 [Gallowayella concinna]
MGAVAAWSETNDWDSALSKCRPVGRLDLGIAALYKSTVHSSSQTPLRLGHVVIGLQAGIRHMSAHGRFQEFTVWLYVNGMDIGAVGLNAVPGVFSIAEPDTDVLWLPNNIPPVPNQLKNNTNVGADSGRLPDPIFPALELVWHYERSRQFVHSEVLTTILNAVVHVAQEPQVMHHDQIYGHGIMSLLELSIERRQPLWTKTSAQKGLILLATAYISNQRWLAMDFKLTWRTQIIADGYLWEKLRMHRSGTLGTTTLEQ